MKYGIRRIGTPQDGVVLVALRTCEHLPYLATIIIELLHQNREVHLVGLSAKNIEIALFKRWIDSLSETQKAKITLFAFKEKRIKRMIQETIEYILNLKSNDQMTGSERTRTHPSFVLHMYEKRRKLIAGFVLLLLKAISCLPRKLFFDALKWNEKENSKIISNEIKSCKPAFLIASPGNMRGCKERIWIQECKARDIRTAIVVLSWDNPTTKGVYIEKPDVVFAQSDFQREVIIRQGFDHRNVQVVGSAHIERLMKSTKNGLAKGFRSKRIIYLGSSTRTAVNQRVYLEDIIEIFEGCNNVEHELIIRPHPKNPINESLSKHFSGKDGIFIQNSQIQMTREENSEYASLLLTADFVIGEATSALVEAKVLGAKAYLLCYSNLDRSDERHLVELQQSKFIELVKTKQQLKKIIQENSEKTSSEYSESQEKWHPRVVSNSTSTSKSIVDYMVLLSKGENNQADVNDHQFR